MFIHNYIKIIIKTKIINWLYNIKSSDKIPIAKPNENTILLLPDLIKVLKN